jgi:ribosome-associated toxin RatA of RatAB toxin-antitoxin module
VRSVIGIDVEAPAGRVFSLARSVERWPDMLPHYVSVRVEDRRGDGSIVARFVARRSLPGLPGIDLPVAWRAQAWSEFETRRLRFIHRSGPTLGMDVTWLIEPTPAGCRVTIHHDFSPRIPGWAWFIDSVFVRPIASQTLATFKAIAEAMPS